LEQVKYLANATGKSVPSLKIMEAFQKVDIYTLVSSSAGNG